MVKKFQIDTQQFFTGDQKIKVIDILKRMTIEFDISTNNDIIFRYALKNDYFEITKYFIVSFPKSGDKIAHLAGV